MCLRKELRAIPGAEHLNSVDSMSLEVCTRSGTQVVIHQDQAKQWTNAGADYAELFADLKAEHDKRFLKILTKGSRSVVLAEPGPPSMEEAQSPAGVEDAPEPAPKGVVYESFEKFTEKEEVKFRCPS